MRYLNGVMVMILMISPAVLLVAPKVANAGIYLLLICSLIAMVCRFMPLGKGFLETAREYWHVNLAMAGMGIAIFLHQFASGVWILKDFDMPLRLLLFAPAFWVLLSLSPQQLKKIQWGLAAGALVGAGVLYVELSNTAIRPVFILGDKTLNPFGNTVLIMGILVLFSIGWNQCREKLPIACKLLIGCASVYASYLSQTRGSWIAIPAFILIALPVFVKKPNRRSIMVIIAAAAVAASLAMSTKLIHTRFNDATRDIEQYVNGGNPDTSIGLRFQMWKAAWVLFTEHPFFGIGQGQYQSAVKELANRHVITPFAATFPHSHNELLYNMATLGIFGLTAMLALYFVPLFLFAREIHHPEKDVRTVAGMGLALTLGFFIFGLTDLMFFYGRAGHTFYSFCLAALLACLVRRKNALTEQQP